MWCCIDNEDNAIVKLTTQWTIGFFRQCIIMSLLRGKQSKGMAETNTWDMNEIV